MVEEPSVVIHNAAHGPFFSVKCESGIFSRYLQGRTVSGGIAEWTMNSITIPEWFLSQWTEEQHSQLRQLHSRDPGSISEKHLRSVMYGNGPYSQRTCFNLHSAAYLDIRKRPIEALSRSLILYWLSAQIFFPVALFYDVTFLLSA